MSKSKNEGNHGELSGQRICEGCHESFSPKRDWQRFCDTACKNAYWYKKYKETELQPPALTTERSGRQIAQKES